MGHAHSLGINRKPVDLRESTNMNVSAFLEIRYGEGAPSISWPTSGLRENKKEKN
jgi:hypothetical protein